MGDGAVVAGVGGLDDAGEVEFVSVKAEEVDERVVVLEGVDIHEHGTGGVGRVGDEYGFLGAAVEAVDEPGVDGAEAEVALFVG